MSSDEEVAYATIAAVSQAKMGCYSPLLEDENNVSSAIGADAKTLAKMLVEEEKKVLYDLRQQLMSVVRTPFFVIARSGRTLSTSISIVDACVLTERASRQESGGKACCWCWGTQNIQVS